MVLKPGTPISTFIINQRYDLRAYFYLYSLGHFGKLTTMMDSFINFPQDKTLVDLFEEQVLRTPENIAVEFEGETFTYQSLSDNSSRLATFLKDKGISKGELVAVAIERSARLVTTMLAILKVGAAYVPIDPDFPNERISF